MKPTALTAEQVSLLREIRRHFKIVSVKGRTPLDGDSLDRVMREEGLVTASFGLEKPSLLGFTRAGVLAIEKFAKNLRTHRHGALSQVSNRTLAAALSKQLIALWASEPSKELTDNDLEAAGLRIDGWFDSHSETITHYIPCNLSPHHSQAFTIGPVRFFHRENFPFGDFGVTEEEFHAAISGGPDNHGFSSLFEFMRERHSDWVAVCSVPAQESAQSQLTADLMVDVALAAIKLATPLDVYRFAARSTARAAPVWRPRLTLTSEGSPAFGIKNDQPGLTVGTGGLHLILHQSKELLAAIGGRLSRYLSGSSQLPTLDEAWCNAAYWYQEAVSEPLESVAVVKFETAIEVLFRSESAKGSKRRLKDGLEVLLGLREDDLLPSLNVTAGDLATSIVTARSRVLHGTWPTLRSDMPEVSGGAAAGFGPAEGLARALLTRMAAAIDEFEKSSGATDAVDALLTWKRGAKTLPSAV